jgi:TP901 family phage tail tape measure protein
MAEVRAEIGETAGLSSSLQSLGTALTLGLTVPVVALGAVSLKVFSDFDAGMRNINAIMQLPEDQLKKLSSDVLKFGEDTRNGASAAANALYTIVSAGFGVNDSAQAMQLLAIASKTAEAGLADENTVAQILAQGLLAYGKSASDAAHFSDILTQTVNLGVGSMDDVAASMGQAINISALAKVSWDDLNASAAFLTQRGMSFANAYTSLNQVISQLIKPTEGLKAAFAELGVASGTELIAKYGGLGGALQALGSVAGTSADDLAKLFTNVRALRGVASILGNFDQYGQLMKEFGANVEGLTSKAQAQQLKSLASQFDYLKSHVLGFLTILGQDLAPLFGVVTDVLGEFFMNLSKLDPVVVQTAVSIGLFLATLGPLALLLSFILSPLGLLIAGIVLLGKMWSDNFLGIQDAVKAALPNINKALDDIHLALITFYVETTEELGYLLDIYNEYLSTDMAHLLKDVLLGNWEQAKTDLVAVIVDLQQAIQAAIYNNSLEVLLVDALDVPIDIITGDWNRLKTDLEEVWTGIVAVFNENFAKPLGDALSSLGGDKFSTLSLGLLSVGAAVLVVAGALGLAQLPAALVAIGAVISGVLLSPLALLAGALLIAIGLVAAYQSNWMGFKTWVDTNIPPLIKTFTDGFSLISDAISDFVTNDVPAALNSLRQLIFLTTYFLQGEDSAKSVLSSLFPELGVSNPYASQGTNNNPGISSGGGIGGGIPMPTLPPDWGSPGNPMPSVSGTASIWPNMQQGGSYQTNNISIQSNDPQYILNELRRQGIDLSASRRG